MNITTTLLFKTGILSLFSLAGFIYLAVTIALVLTAWKIKNNIPIIASLILSLVVFVLHLIVFPLFPVGKLQTFLVQDNHTIGILVHNLGLIIIPILITLLGLKLSKK